MESLIPLYLQLESNRAYKLQRIETHSYRLDSFIYLTFKSQEDDCYVFDDHAGCCYIHDHYPTARVESGNLVYIPKESFLKVPGLTYYYMYELLDPREHPFHSLTYVLPRVAKTLPPFLVALQDWLEADIRLKCWNESNLAEFTQVPYQTQIPPPLSSWYSQIHMYLNREDMSDDFIYICEGWIDFSVSINNPLVKYDVNEFLTNHYPSSWEEADYQRDRFDHQGILVVYVEDTNNVGRDIPLAFFRRLFSFPLINVILEATIGNIN